MYPYYYNRYYRPPFHHHHCETNRHGIPLEDVSDVCVEIDRVVFKVQPESLGKLHGEKGIFTLAVKCLPDLTTSALPVFISDGHRSKPLMYDTGVNMTGSEFQNGHYYLFWYDKCDNTIILMNAEATPAPLAAPAAATTTVTLAADAASARTTKTSQGS